ncbi:NLR family CARD domain-containing protein 3-like [Dysidea avara]|uniref:NLR family CARD domain-containing protein 3-like n=1 Tax=Dysidea avara TaxID=196820 RepID=UPI0033215ED3
MAAERRESDPFLEQVMKCTLLEEATIMITSRPHACDKLHAGRRVEVVGFGKEEIREFVEKSFPNDAKCVEEFTQQLEEYPHLESLSYVPMNLVMIVDIFECSEKKLPSTITQLYRLFIVMTLERQVRKENERKQLCFTVPAADSVDEKLCKLLTGVPKEALSTLLLLCRLAYLGFFDWYSDREDKEWRMWKDPKIIFTVADLKECGIEVTAEWDGYGILKVTHTHQLPTDSITYNFAHFTIQEFLCAVYISTLSQEEQQRLLSEHFSDYPNVFIFLCGLTGLVSSEMYEFVCSKINESTLVETPTEVLLRCLYESQQTSPLHSVKPIRLYVHGASFNFLQPYNLLCFSHVLSYCPVLELNVSLCHIGDKGAELLAKHYPNRNTTGQLLEVFTFTGNDLTVDGLVHALKIVKTNIASLRVLDVGGNPIGDDGMLLLSSTLQYNTILTELMVSDCGLSVKGAIYISEMFKKCSLQVLSVYNNNIGDDGITAIAGALSSNSLISELNVGQCDITFNGADSLAAGLLVNNSIRKLHVWGNPITVEGACLILQSAISNGVCREVLINATYQTDDEVKEKMLMLKQGKRQNQVEQQQQQKQHEKVRDTKSDAVCPTSSKDVVRQKEIPAKDHNVQVNGEVSREHHKKECCSIM